MPFTSADKPRALPEHPPTNSTSFTVSPSSSIFICLEQVPAVA